VTATRAPCEHTDALPVESAVTGTTLAYLCPTCDAQLPADFGMELTARRAAQARQEACSHEEAIEITSWGKRLVRWACARCGITLPRHAEGGLITGPRHPGEDDIAVWLSPGGHFEEDR
jgi:hypothetical protein